MQTERLFEIVYTLLDRGTVTAQELADRLGVSKRTILRDIETLTLAKVPVYTTQGKGGGVSLLDGYVLDKAVLSDEEKEQILLGIKTLLPTGGASGKALSEARFPLFSKEYRLDRGRFFALEQPYTRPREIQQFEKCCYAEESARLFLSELGG